MLEREDRIDAIGKALYDYKPTIEQETDPVDGSPAGEAWTVPWETIRTDYPATYEAIIGAATICASYLDRCADFPVNIHAGTFSREDFTHETKVVKIELLEDTGTVDGEPWEGQGGTWFVDVVWDKTGCCGACPISDLVRSE